MHSACHRKCLVQKFPSYFEHCKLRWKYCHLCEWDFDALHSLIVYTNTSNMTCIIHSTLVIFYSHWSIPKNVLSSLSWSNWKTFRKSRLKFFLFKTKENNKAYTVKILVHLNLPVQICSSIPWGYMYLLNVAVLSSPESFCEHWRVLLSIRILLLSVSYTCKHCQISLVIGVVQMKCCWWICHVLH